MSVAGTWCSSGGPQASRKFGRAAGSSAVLGARDGCRQLVCIPLVVSEHGH
jgi:hypothetical protein